MVNSVQTNNLYQHLMTIGSETTTEEELQDLFNKPITINFNDHTATVPFSAETYNLLVQMLEAKNEEN